MPQFERPHTPPYGDANHQQAMIRDQDRYDREGTFGQESDHYRQYPNGYNDALRYQQSFTDPYAAYAGRFPDRMSITSSHEDRYPQNMALMSHEAGDSYRMGSTPYNTAQTDTLHHLQPFAGGDQQYVAYGGKDPYSMHQGSFPEQTSILHAQSHGEGENHSLRNEALRHAQLEAQQQRDARRQERMVSPQERDLTSLTSTQRSLLAMMEAHETDLKRKAARQQRADERKALESRKRIEDFLG
jgi:hypothetical protein